MGESLLATSIRHPLFSFAEGLVQPIPPTWKVGDTVASQRLAALSCERGLTGTERQNAVRIWIVFRRYSMKLA